MKGGSVRRRIAGLLAACALFAQAAAAAPVEFDLPAGAATETLSRFARQAGIALVFPYDLASGRNTRTVRGRHEPEAALRLLLQGSGLSARRDDRGEFVIERERLVVAAPSSRDPIDLDVVPATPLSEVMVTGSRLDLSGMASATPVTAVDSRDLDVYAPGALVDALARLPHFLNNDTPESQSFGSSAAAGASHLNLRGIGSIRTLTLVDGRRIVPSTRFGMTDLALLPRSLVRRVEVVTGGASAAYGSDAVSGVVNVLLDTGFEGSRFTAQGGITELGDNPSSSIDVLFGRRLGDDTHVVFAAEGYRADGIRGYDSRSWYVGRAAITNPAPTGPREVRVDDVRAVGYTYGGLITSGPLANTQFLPGGRTAPFVSGDYRSSQTQSGGDGVDPARDIVWILPSQQRLSAFTRVSSDLTPSLTVFTQLLGGYSENLFGKDPASLWGPWEATIYDDNAFLPADIRSRMASAGVSSFRFGRVAEDDLGRPRVYNRSLLLSGTAGFEWDVADWKLDGYYQYGHNRNELSYVDVLRIDLAYRALDSVIGPNGTPLCRSTLTFPDDGCVPLNLFGQGSPSQAAREYVTSGHLTQLQTVGEHVAEVTARGEPFALPTGPVRVAAGVNWRREIARSYPQRTPAWLEGAMVVPASTQGYRGLPAAYLSASTIFERAVEARTAGEYDVREVFTEAALPVLPSVSVTAALRYADYSGSGGIAAWKGGADWQVNDALRLRATRSRDVRAGNLSERLDTSSSGVTVRDPFLDRNYAIIAIRGANPAVEPEKGDTTTAGFVFQPHWRIPFALSADYYDIRISDAISTLGVQNIIDSCFKATADVCGLIRRNADTGDIVQVNNQVLNFAQSRSRGVDLELYWRNSLQLFGGAESVAFRALGNISIESSTTVADSGTRVDRRGQTGVVGGTPDWQLNFSTAYQRDNVQVSIQQQIISSGIYSAMNVINGPDSIDDNSMSGVWYTNLRAEWRPSRSPALMVFGHISNLFDRDPPSFGDWGFGGSLATNESLFDPLGRRYSLGIRIEL